MVTCKVDSAVVPKMSRPRKTSSTSSGFRLLDSDQMDTHSTVSRNSIYKIKIDSMFDETRSITNNRFDDRRGSHRTRSIIMYGKSELQPPTNINHKKTSTKNQQQQQQQQQENDDTGTISASVIDDFRHSSESRSSDVGINDIDNNNKQNNNDSGQINNSVQAQIERMFTDVVKDATCSFSVRCLGSLPLKDKVTSLQGLQEPLRQLYLSELGQGNQCNGQLDICGSGLRIRQNCDKDVQITPFHNIAVWSAVKFIVSQEEGGAAFLPLITDPESIDKASLFRPLTAADQRRLSSGLHAPIVAVVMRSSGPPKYLECHGFVCQTSEDAIVIAATLYQSLMAHVNTNSNRSTKKHTPRNQNGVSCISIASSSALTGSNYMSRSNGSLNGVGRKNSLRNSNKNGQTPSLPIRKKRIASSSLSGGSDKMYEKTTEERKKKSHKTKRAPPIPTPARNIPNNNSNNNNNISRSKPQTIPAAAADIIDFDSISGSDSYSVTPKQSLSSVGGGGGSNSNGRNSNIPVNDSQYHTRNNGGGGGDGGDILTRVAIPRSGSFLNTGGLTRYKSRATNRHTNKSDGRIGGCGGGGGGGGGGSPLGFSELFNEFRLHENLHSLDDILSAIINADGMSFNDLKPIYKEFLLKLAVTLTKDELYQRSKNIMRRQKKKKLKRKNQNVQKKSKYFLLGFGFKNVFRFGKFRSNKSRSKSSNHNNPSIQKQSSNNHHHQNDHTNQKIKDNHRKCGATIGSDFSLARNENTLNGLHRNSSSGYVSCSECSYDSEACTCASADRCYCSLGADHDNINEKFKNHKKQQQRHHQQKQQQKQSSSKNHRNSLKSYRNDDKCYCSMGDTPPEDDDDDDDNDDETNSDTTWCDTDSCHSLSKCYCKNRIQHQQKQQINNNNNNKNNKKSFNVIKDLQKSDPIIETKSIKKTKNKIPSKLGLDYELFTIGKDIDCNHHHNRYDNHHHINKINHINRGPSIEALSVKKSVEAAAIFADVKLSQTTDIKSLRPLNGIQHIINQKYTRNIESISISKKSISNNHNNNNKRHYESKSSDRQPKSISSSGGRRSTNHQQQQHQQNYRKSYSADDILKKLTEKSNSNYHRSNNNKNSIKDGNIGESYYQSMRAVSASLEDSLGYLP